MEKIEKNNNKIIEQEAVKNINNMNNKYSFIRIFNFTLMNLFRAVLIYMLVDAIIIGDKDRILLVALTSLTSFYREYIRLFTGVKISVGMQIIITTFIILASLIGTLMGMYDKIHWWDTMLHGVSGILTSFLGLMVLAIHKNRNNNLRYSVALIVSFAFFFSITAGIVWELMEFSADTVLDYNAQRSKGVDYGVQDTMHDIVANTVGSILTCGGIYFYFKKKEEKQIYEILHNWYIVPSNEQKPKAI